MKKFMIIFLLILFASKSFAEGPSVTTKWLMRDSLSMFEWGLLQLDEEIKEYVNKEQEEWSKCSARVQSIDDRVKKINIIKEKKEDDRTQREVGDLILFEMDEGSYQLLCKHYIENGRIGGSQITYDFDNDKIYVVFGQNYLRDPDNKNLGKHQTGDTHLLSAEKCIYNRNKIATEIFFYNMTEHFEGLSELSNSRIDEIKMTLRMDFFSHRYFARPDEPSNLYSHLFSIINIGVLLGTGYNNEKAVFCWENLKSSSPSIKIGKLQYVMFEVYEHLFKDTVFYE